LRNRTRGDFFATAQPHGLLCGLGQYVVVRRNDTQEATIKRYDASFGHLP
jgi:hypothetical protein